MTTVVEHAGGPSQPGPALTVVQPSPKKLFRRDIGGLRALAVLLVVIYHARVPGVSGGYIGVDVFFVISGFLISGQLLREVEVRGRIDLIAFYARRMRRLLPAALLVVLVTLAAARLVGPVLQVRATATDAIWAAAYGINFHLAAEGVDYQQSSGPQSPLQHFWSLAVEEQFYLLWPLLLLVACAGFVRLAPRLVRPAAAVAIALVTGASLYWSSVLTGDSAPTAYFSVQTRAWEFGVGALIALAAGMLVRLPRFLAVGGAWLGVAAICWAAFSFDDTTPFPGTAALVPVVGTAAVIAAGCRNDADRSAPGRVFAWRPVQWVGRVSYAWYLWHWPLLILAPSVLGYELTWVHALEISVLALWLAALTHLVVELPVGRRPLRRSRWLTIGIAMSLATVAAGGAVSANPPTTGGSDHYARPVTLDGSDRDEATLRAALAAGSRLRAVPANLTPGLGSAADDVPVTQSGCHLDFLQVAQGMCAYGDPAAKHTVVLFGDSHAQQWDGALIAAANRAQWRVISWTKAACPFAQVSLVNPTLKRTYRECDQWRDRTVQRIKSLQPDLVIATQSDSVAGKALTNNDWSARTVATLEALQGAGIRVHYLADTPYPRGDVPACLAANPRAVDSCQLMRGDAYHQSTYYAQRHQQVVTTVRAAGFPVTDPIAWICSSSVCPVIVGNTLVYRDESHLTNTYSTLLGPLVEPLLTTHD